MQAMQFEARDPDWADKVRKGFARGDVYVEKVGVSTRCAIMQQTLMTMHGREDLPPTPPCQRQN